MAVQCSVQIVVALVVNTVAMLATYFCTQLYHARNLIYERQKMGLPVAPGHNFFFGHLLYLKSMLDKLPSNAHYQSAFSDIARQHFSRGGVFYLDLWPVSGLFLVTVSPNVATQIHTNPAMSTHRPKLLPRFFKPICGGPSLFDLPEHMWRPWRAVFTKAFSPDHNLSLVPGIVDDTLVYCETLRDLALKKNMCHLDLITPRFSIDAIGKAILNASLNAQRGYNTLADCMLSQIRWHQANAQTNPLEYLNIVRLAVQWWNGRKMDDYIGKELDKRYSSYKKDPDGNSTRSVMDLVLQAYLLGNAESSPEKLDSGFRAFAISQIRLFVFVGHDSTSSTICYILYLLAKSPAALAQIRAEHDKVFGANPSAVLTMLKEQAHLTNNLPYTTAVIKESLRLFPPGGCSRAGSPDVDLTDDDGSRCPTKDTEAVVIVHPELHRAPAYWIQPDDFIPERWLSDCSSELQPPKGAYRAFEIGPRNCVAQGFVMTELRVILACMIRQFDFAPAYDEWDRLHPSKGLRTYRGERAYQIEEGAAHPVNHFPCRVLIRGIKSERDA